MAGLSQRAISRRELFRGSSRGAKRPPWALPESEFTDTCERCADCVKACPEKILIFGSGGFPEVDFRKGGCTFCAECAGACPVAAFGRVEGHAPWALSASIEGDCLSARGVTCRSCGDVCPERAITFTVMTGGRAEPAIAANACTGCGACLRPCPTNAITMIGATL